MQNSNESGDLGAMPRKPRKGIYVLPNLFTLAALFGGFYAIVMAMNNKFELAAVGVFCAMVLDSLDGRVARMTHTQSAFGEQMDSLSDMVSFGAAPALIAYEWALRPLGRSVGGVHVVGGSVPVADHAGRVVEVRDQQEVGEAEKKIEDPCN